jgi:hypothetical protein
MRLNLSTALLAAPLLALALIGCTENDSVGPIADDGPDLGLAGRQFVQIDRMGLPAIATVFIPTSKKDAYNTAEPANDRATFGADVDAVLNAFGVPNPALKTVVLPDIIPFNTQSSAGFLNGRRLADDVITAELGIIFGSIAALNDDHVDANDKEFSTKFPYLASPAR